MSKEVFLLIKELRKTVEEVLLWIELIDGSNSNKQKRKKR